jgi:3'-phosphoadenosine 5'-phosphosulfate sulfotransferase (PAPS reductase)/FAD synthetase
MKKLALENGYDGIRYYDAQATGEEFVLYNIEKLDRNSATGGLANQPALFSQDQLKAIEIEQMTVKMKEKYADKAANIIAMPYESKEEIEFQRQELLNWILAEKATVIIAFSGGKDSVAMVLQAIYDFKIPKEQIELWHHDVDGDGPNLWDWGGTKSYCIAFAKAFDIKIVFSYAQGGITREIYRTKETIQPIFFQKEEGGEFIRVEAQQKPEFMTTRRKFPAVGKDLNVRWCSWIAKIGVMNKAINNTDRFKSANICIMTGERRLESANRAKYKEIEPYRSMTSARRAITWRPIIDWTEKQVWDAFELHKVQPHPCYELGWGRCSCQLCIFSRENVWASINEISPEKVERIAEIENDLGFTLYGDKKGNKDIYESKVNKGTSFIDPAKRARWYKEATEEFVSPIFVEQWTLPQGAFSSEESGAN